MKKLLAIFMAVVMIATMFSFTAVVFAEETEEANVMVKYAGGSQATIREYNKGGGTTKVAYRLDMLTEDAKSKKPIVAGINEDVASGEYSAYYIYLNGGYSGELVIKGIKGTETTPVIIQANDNGETGYQIPTFKNDTAKAEDATSAPAIKLENCEYVTINGATPKGTSASLTIANTVYEGIEIVNCKEVTVKNVVFTENSYKDYSLDETKKDETGAIVIDPTTGNPVLVKPNMETIPLEERGISVKIGAGNTNVAIENCDFSMCRAGIVFDSNTAVAEGEEALAATTGVAIKDCKFSKIVESAVILNGAKDVTVSGGYVEFAGGLALAEDFDGRDLAAIAVNGGENITVSGVEVAVSEIAVAVNGTKNAIIEKIYSRGNAAFTKNTFTADANAKIRYNISANDGASVISTTEASGIKIYNNTFVGAAGLDMSNLSDIVVKNNIFDMAIGNKVILGDGEFGSNCYHFTSKAKGDSKSIKKNPLFANAWTDADVDAGIGTFADNYILSSKSPCLGKGVKVEDDMGATDFYGNAIGDTINIGADAAGTGAEATYKLTNEFADFFAYLIALIRNLFGLAA